MKKRYLMPAILGIPLFLVQCGTNTRMMHSIGPTAAVDLKDLAQFRQVFNGDQGRVRLVALISPL